MVSPPADSGAGQELRDRKLLVNSDAARVVIGIYRRYLALRSVHVVPERFSWRPRPRPRNLANSRQNRLCKKDKNRLIINYVITG